MVRKMAVVDLRNNEISPYPRENARQLEEAPDSEPALELIGRLRDQCLNLQCECGLRFHTVERGEALFLRRNPNQLIECTLPCGIGKSLHLLDRRIFFDEPVTLPTGEGGPLLSPRRSQRENGLGTDRNPRLIESTRKRRTGFLKMYQILFGILYRIGLNGWTPEHPLWDWNRFWDEWHFGLKSIRFTPGNFSAADISWCPSIHVKGLERGLFFRTSQVWDLEAYQPEAWVFFICERIDPNGVFEGHRLSPKVREGKARRGEPSWTPFRFKIKKNRIAVVGETGPYLGFSLVALDQKSQAIKPQFLVLHSVAASSWPLPVRNRLERQAAFLLWRLGIPFEKPLFRESPDWPDFILPAHKALILIRTVAGARTDERVQTGWPSFPAFRVFSIDACDGGFRAFEAEVRGLI